MRRNRKTMLIALTVLALCPAVMAQSPDWTYETPVVGGTHYTTRPVAFSPVTGEPTIAIGAAIAERNAGTWTVDTFGTGGAQDLAYDPSGRPCLSYLNGSGKAEVRYACRSGSKWSYQTVERVYVDPETSLAFDPVSGNPAIAYGVAGSRKGPSQVKFARWTGSSWSVQVVDSIGQVGARWVSLAFGRDGNPAIAYSADANSDAQIDSLRYAKFDPWQNKWNIEVVDPGPQAGAVPSLAFDPVSGDAAIAYRASNIGLRFARRGTSGWTSTLVDAVQYIFDPDLAFDNLGRAYIGYVWSPSVAGEFRLAWNNAGTSTWSIETVDISPNVGDSVAVAVNPATRVPVMVYWAYSFPNLRYAARRTRP